MISVKVRERRESFKFYSLYSYVLVPRFRRGDSVIKGRVNIFSKDIKSFRKFKSSRE